MEEGWWRYTPVALTHVFWRQKEQFQLACDTYSDWVLFAVTEGRFQYTIEGTSGEAGFGDVVFAPPHTAFHRSVLEPVSFHYYMFRWEPISPAVGSHPVSSLPNPVGSIAVKDHNRLSSTYFYLQQLNMTEEAVQLRSAQALFQDLWHQICRERAMETSRRGGEQGTRDMEMDDAARWIRQHAFEPLRMKDFSKGRKISPVQLTRRFQSAWGQSPMDFLTTLRMQKAKTLLLETRLPLDEIALRCGYENGFYLSRVFTKKVKMNPSKFRKVNRL